MSNSLLTRATEALQRRVSMDKAKRLMQKQELAALAGGGAQLASAPLSAVIDIKLGKDGEQAKVLKVVPINALIGLPPALISFFLVKYPALAALSGGLGFGQLNNSLYRLILDVHAKHVAEQAQNPQPAAQ